MTLAADLDSFYLEHLRCGEPENRSPEAGSRVVPRVRVRGDDEVAPASRTMIRALSGFVVVSSLTACAPQLSSQSVRDVDAFSACAGQTGAADADAREMLAYMLGDGFSLGDIVVAVRKRFARD